MAFPALSQLQSRVQSSLRPQLQKLGPLIDRASDQLNRLIPVVISGGKRQSPIDLLPSETAFDASLQQVQLRADYGTAMPTRLENTGTALRIVFAENDGGQLTADWIADAVFHLETIDLHWGMEPMDGSLHFVGGVGYAAELEMFHRNIKYGTMEEALKQEDGVLAVAVFLNETHDDNVNLNMLIEQVPHLIYRGHHSIVRGQLNVGRLLPEKLNEFWLYPGSETSPPYRENVSWVVLRSAIPVSSCQLDRLRQMRAVSEEDAERPNSSIPRRATQPTNGRLIRSSFRAVAQQTMPIV